MFQIQSLFALSQAPVFSGNFLLLFGIALSACLLGVQVACIVVLAKKLRFARRESERMEGQDSRDSYSQYGIAALGASLFPMSVEGVLAIAVALNALAALVLVILTISVRSSGYNYATVKDLTAKKKRVRAVPRYTAEPLPESEEPRVAAEPVEQEMSEETYEPLEETVESAEETEPEELAVAAFAGTAVEAPSTTTTVTTVEEFRDGQNPVRVVKIEKEYTETVRETIPGTAAPAESDDQTERLIEKIDRLIEKLEGGNDEQRSHLENGIILASDEPVPADEDDEDEDFSDDALSTDENAEEDETSDEVDDREYFTGNERIIGFDEDTGYYIVAHYRKSFEAKLIQARPNIKQYYSELKNALLSYKGTKSRISWTADSFHNGRTQIAKINVKSRILELYLALDPASLEGTVYRGQDVSHLKKYADTPFRYKLRTPRKFKWAMELVARVCEEQGLSPIDIERVDYEAMYPFEDTDSLVSRGLIKEYIREEKPASIFELDESHVPSLADMDDSVIPANANISWEFDNEVMAEKEPEPIEEPEVEPVEEEPTPTEQPAAPTPTVVRETTRTTQVRYTEQYFGEASGEPTTTYKEYLSEDGPFKVDFFENDDKKEETEPADVTEEPVSSEDASDTTDEEIYEESCEESYEETEETVEEPDDVPWESEEDTLDWSVPAGISEEETVVIDAVETYDDDGDESIAEESYGESYDETYDSEEYAYDEDYDETSDEVIEEQDEEATEPSVQAPKMNPEVALVDVSLLEEHFEEGDVIDLQALKDRGLVLESAKMLRICKTSPEDLTKSFTVIADNLSVDAIFAIHRANGNIQKINKLN